MLGIIDLFLTCLIGIYLSSLGGELCFVIMMSTTTFSRIECKQVSTVLLNQESSGCNCLSILM